MRWLVLMVLIAGCTSPPEDAPPTDPLFGEDVEPLPPLPEPLTFSGTVGPGAPGTCPNTCVYHDFRTNASWRIMVELSWTTASNDLDLYLRANGNVWSSTVFIPQTQEQIVADGAPGEYEIEIVPYASGPEDYDVTVTFDHLLREPPS